MRTTAVEKTMALTFCLVAGLVQNAFSYSFSTWCGMTGAKTLALDPYVYSSMNPSFALSTDLIVGYGFSERMHLFVNARSIDWYPDLDHSGTWLMPRYD